VELGRYGPTEAVLGYRATAASTVGKHPLQQPFCLVVGASLERNLLSTEGVTDPDRQAALGERRPA
jgi:hypothetical protein